MKYVREGTYARVGEARSGRGVHTLFSWKQRLLQQHAHSRTENYEMSFDTAEEEKKKGGRVCIRVHMRVCKPGEPTLL